MGIDCKKVGCQTKKALIVFSKACCRSARGHPFLSGILAFFVLLYAFFPAAAFFLLSNSPVIICTAIILGTLLSFGHPHIPEICEEKEEKTREISQLKGDGGVDLVATEKDGNSEMEVPLLEKERNTMETVDEEGIRNRNLGDEGGEIKGGDSLYLEIQKKDERIVSGGATDEADLVFTPRQGRTREALGLGTGRLEKAIHESRLAGNSKAGESQDDSSNRGKFYCRSNSRRTVRFVMSDTGKDKEEIKVEEDHVEEAKHKADDFEVRDKVPEAYVEDSFSSSLGSPWIRIDHHDQSSSGLDHDDQFSHSSSEHAESSSPDASMADILPMLDELHPLLDSETPQPASLEASEGNSEQSSEHHHSDDEDDNDEEDDDDDDDGSTEMEKEGGENREGETKGHEAMSGVKWTDDDTKNVMDLGSSELERNRRLENLMAKRRARRNQKIELEKDLIDLQSDEKISLLDMDDSSFNILDSVSLQASPFLVRSATLPAIRRNPFDLPSDREEELAEVSVPASARAVSTFSTKRNPFDLPYDHAGMDGMLTGETSSHGDFMAVQQKGLYANEAHLLGRSQFGGFEGFHPVNSPLSTSLAEPHKQHTESSFHGHHVADAMPQVTTSNRDPLGEEEMFSTIKKGNTDSSMSCLFQTQKDHELHGEANGTQIVDAATYASVEPGDSDSSSPERESDSEEEEEKHMEVQRGQSNLEEGIVHDVESVASDITEELVQEPESFDHHVGSSSHFPGLEEEPEMPSEEMQMKSRKVHMEVARLGSPEHVILPLDESPRKQYAASDVVEEDFDDSSSSTSSDGEEVQFGGDVNEENASFWNDASTSTTEIAQPCSREPDILVKEADDSRVGEPVFDSSPSAQEKFHSGLAALVEGDPFTEKGIFPCSSGNSDAPVGPSEQGSHDIEVEKNIVHEFKEEIADGESKSVSKPSMAFSESEDLLADVVPVPVGENQSHTNLSNQPHLPEVKEAVIETIQPSNNQEKADDIHVAESSPRDLGKDGEAFAHVHAHPSNAEEVSATAAISVGDLPVTTSERMPLKGDISAVDLFSVGDYHVSEVNDSSENAHQDFLQSANALPVDQPPTDLTLLTGSQISEPKDFHQSSGLSDREHGTSEMIQGGYYNGSPKNIHISSSDGTRQAIADENNVSTSRVSNPALQVSNSSAMDDDKNRPNIAQISKDHLGADHDVWLLGEEEVACIKDLDEDLLTELDRIGDFIVAEETTSMNRPQKQLEMHSSGESKEDAEMGDLIQMPVLEAKSIEDISHALKQFSEGEPSHGQSELEAIEARSLDDMEELMMQLSKEFSEKHGDGSKVMQLHDLSDEHAELEVPEARPREDIELVLEQINKENYGEEGGIAFTKEQENKVEADVEKVEPQSAETVPNSAVHEMHSLDKGESDGDKKEDIHRGDRKEEVHHSLDVHHGDRKEEVNHGLGASEEHVETKENKDSLIQDQEV